MNLIDSLKCVAILQQYPRTVESFIFNFINQSTAETLSTSPSYGSGMIEKLLEVSAAVDFRDVRSDILALFYIAVKYIFRQKLLRLHLSHSVKGLELFAYKIIATKEFYY